MAGNTATKTGVALVGGAGETLLGYFAGVTVLPALLPIVGTVLGLPLLLLLPAVLPVIGDLAFSEQRIRNDIKKQFSKPIPDNQVTIFQAIVEGYVDKEGETHPGLRESLQNHFRESSNNLKSDINNFVANLVRNQLTQIEKQIDAKESNRFDRGKCLEVHATHLEHLKEIGKELAELEETIQRMSNASTEGSIPIS